MVGVRSGANDPAVIVTFVQLLWIVLAHVVGGVLLCDGEIRLEKANIGLETLGQVGAHRAPVIHLHIDVMPKASRPRRVKILAPGALQVSGQALLTRARNQQVAAVLEHQLFKPVVPVPFLIFFEKNVRRISLSVLSLG